MEKQHDNPFQFTKAVILLPLFFVLTLWLVFWYELQFQHNLSHFGIYPREVFGLKGILFSPFLHGDIEHLTNNSIALLVFVISNDILEDFIALIILKFRMVLPE